MSLYLMESFINVVCPYSL